jgi:hypothetical protein
MRVSFGHEERRLLVPEMYGESVRRPDRLRHLWAHDRELTSPGTKLSSSVPGKTI